MLLRNEAIAEALPYCAQLTELRLAFNPIDGGRWALAGDQEGAMGRLSEIWRRMHGNRASVAMGTFTVEGYIVRNEIRVDDAL